MISGKRAYLELSETESDQEISAKLPEKKASKSAFPLGNKLQTTEVGNIYDDSSSDSGKSKGNKEVPNLPEPEKLREDDKKIRVKSFKPFTGLK